MQHRNTVLHRLLSHIRWHRFEAHVDRHGSDKHVRTLTTKTQFIAMAYGQLSGADSLRETVTRFNSQADSLYHLGAKPVAKSTMADANAKRCSGIFEDLFKELAAAAQRRVRQAVEEATFLIDSTHLRLNEHSAKWARYSAGVCGAKVHVVYDPDADQPIYAAVSTANVNDITAAKQMPIVAGATYVFDLGYYDYAWWNKMHQAGCRMVTRLKTNTKLTITREKHLPPGRPILADRFGTLPKRQTHNRRNPMDCEMREVVVRIDTGKVIRVLTNDLTSSAQTIADLYKRRWAIELHFRWIKQALKIRKFLGASDNAVRTQVYIALIVFLLLHLAHEAEKVSLNLLDFVRLVRTHLMSRRDIRALDRPEDPRPPPDPRQYGLDWCQA